MIPRHLALELALGKRRVGHRAVDRLDGDQCEAWTAGIGPGPHPDHLGAEGAGRGGNQRLSMKPSRSSTRAAGIESSCITSASRRVASSGEMRISTVSASGNGVKDGRVVAG